MPPNPHPPRPTRNEDLGARRQSSFLVVRRRPMRVAELMHRHKRMVMARLMNVLGLPPPEINPSPKTRTPNGGGFVSSAA